MKCDTTQSAEEFLKIQEQALGPKCAQVATTLIKLANLYFADKNYKKAEENYERSLAIRRELTGFHQDEIKESEEGLERVRNAKQPAQRPAIKISQNLQNELAAFRAIDASDATDEGSLKRTDAVNEILEELAVLRRTVGTNDPSVADLLTHLADIYCRKRMYSKMEPVLRDALKIHESSCGSEHASVARDLKNLAALYIVVGKYTEAEPLLHRALEIREKSFGRSHQRYADVEEQYANLLRKTNRIAEAEKLEKHINEVRSKARQKTSEGIDHFIAVDRVF
jgi:tetratricopeptide (TPR) repeat protein